jgi:hypothetical protein
MQRISSEFAAFVRDTGVRAVDRLTNRTKEVEAPLRPVLRAWSKLSDDQKTDLFDALIATVQGPDDDAAEAPQKSAKRPAAAKSRKKSAAPKKP